ncbi:MAG TPA: hypothetical protein DDY18_05120 [Flavobacterium sp.]|jgi:hypothetical protein|nr:hypothetical protein [Flavobacterium sp.]
MKSRELKAYKLVKLDYKNLPKSELLKTIKRNAWEIADEFEAHSPEEAAEVMAYDYSNDEDEIMLFAVKERGKTPVIIEVEITMHPEANAYRYTYERGR